MSKEYVAVTLEQSIICYFSEIYLYDSHLTSNLTSIQRGQAIVIEGVFFDGGTFSHNFLEECILLFDDELDDDLEAEMLSLDDELGIR